ncbi:low iron-inducible periplasmic protein [Nitzschia inconspicua]|uniref:Low iron-inducible periplasmic protein n=1 Tax=Nitzschia inconspicua TaxID=303405 RepID=A0A9K3PYI6_9STRA|nr:low iron-inducible periplasmic protein [Nitzschia inconspicua]
MPTAACRNRMSHLLLLLCIFGSRSIGVSAQGIDLGGGIVTRTDVEYLADLTLDIRDMRQLLASGNKDSALRIYLEGKNSEKQIGVLFKLSELSTSLADNPLSQATPAYFYHLYGLAGRSTNLEELTGNSAYADRFVREAIQNGHPRAARAALVLNIWMYAAHVLYKGVDTCQKRTDADNPSQFDISGGGLDKFIALWIGFGQTHGSSAGFGLYALTEESDTFFSKAAVDDSGFLPADDGQLAESDANRQIKLLYQQGAGILTLSDVCSSSNKDSPKKLWAVVSQIISKMYVPLLRMLIVSILEQDKEATELYATAVVPQAAQCRPSTFHRLNDELLQGDVNFGRTEVILSDLQEIYACFGLSCDDIGSVLKVYDGVNIPSCIASQNNAPMALYKPATAVGPIARIDLDVLQLRILTSVGLFNFAKVLYLYGRNSPRQRLSDTEPFGYYSIAEFAIASSRKNAEPYYSAFVSYHNDPKYADNLIRKTLDGTGKWDNSKSTEQRSVVIAEASAFLVLYLHLIAQINGAVNNCKNIQDDGEYELTHPWDEVAALLIGSLEGMEEGGSLDVQDGQLIWGLSTRRAFQFQTLNRQGYANINSQLEDLLYAGRGELDALHCSMLEKTAEEVKRLIIVPLMQSVLRYAVQNEQLPADSFSPDLAFGEVYAMAIIPIVQIYDPAAAALLEDNMLSRSGVKPVADGAQEVANAIGAAASAMGINPRSLGSTPEANPSLLHGGSSAVVINPWIISSLGALVTSIYLIL